MQFRPLQASQAPYRAIRFGAFEVDVQTSELLRSGLRVKIDQRSFQILLLLLKNGGELVTREELCQDLWSADTRLDFDRNLNKAISKLRSVLGDSAEKPRFIETLQNRGYRFVATLDFVAAEPSANSISADDRATAADVQCLSPETEMPIAEGAAIFGPFDLNLRTLELRKRGALVSIHQQPLQILLLLLKRHGQLVPREDLRQNLWPPGTHVGFERSLNKGIFKLREALGDSVERPLFIETVPGRGYRFVSSVRFIEGDSETAQISPEDANTARRRSSVHDAEMRQEAEILKAALVDAHGKSHWAYYAAALVAAFMLTTFLWVHFRTAKVVASSSQRNTRVSVAILDFKNLSGEPHEAWLATALSEWLSIELDAGGQLRIIPAQRISEARMELHIADGQPPSAATLAQMKKLLNADFVLSGSYGTLGNGAAARIRVDLFLQDAGSGQTIATVSQTGQESDFLSVISHTGSELRARMGIREVSREEAQQVASVISSNPEAMRFYAEGLHKLRVFDALAAAEPLQKAVAADPSDALAHDALATAWLQLGYDARARAEAQKAFDLSANLPRPQRLMVEGRYQETFKHWDRAIQIYHALYEFFPDNPEYGLMLLNTQRSAGHPQDAAVTVAELRKLPSPLRDDPRIDMAAARVAFDLGDMKQALDGMRIVHRKAAAENASLLLARAEIVEAWVLWNLNQYDKIPPLLLEARRLFAASGDTEGVAEVFHQEGIDFRQAGDYKHAEEQYQQALELFRRIGFMKGVASEFLCLGDARLQYGDLVNARDMFQQSLNTFDQINDEDGIALAKVNLGGVLFTLGNHVAAKKMYQDALEIFSKHEDSRKVAMNANYLGEIFRVEGDMDEAQIQAQRAIRIFGEKQDRGSVLWSQLLVTEILLDTGHIDEAVKKARETTDGLAQEQDVQGQELAGALLAQALCRQGKLDEARKALNRVRSLWDSNQAEAGLAIEFTDGMIHGASSDTPEKDEAVKVLQKVFNDASRMGYANYAYEARLELAEIELSNGNKTAGADQLKNLLRDARHRGFGMIAQRASQDLTANLIAQK